MKKTVQVYGAGPAGLMAAETLAAAGLAVELHDHMPSPARKFLLAGCGGLNLTHSESLENLLGRYGEARSKLEPAIRAFPPDALRAWSHGLGIETFVGSSGRIFPKPMKASPLLRAWLRRLDGMGVTLHSRSPWPGFTGKPCILAFGGASWPHLGSNASWCTEFEKATLKVVPFAPANGRQLVPWTEHFSSRFAGQPLKNLSLSYGTHRVRGEVMITADGLEGGAIYALSHAIRSQPGLSLDIDLRPDVSVEDALVKYQARRSKDSLSNFLRKAFGLSPAGIALMHESRASSPKSIQIKITGQATIARAISSAGGVDWDEVDDTFQLKKQPGVFVAGEMLDWEAPTGGYLLQASFSTGVAAAKGLLASLA